MNESSVDNLFKNISALTSPLDVEQFSPRMRIPEIPTLPASITNPALRMYERLGEYIQEFESKLDEEHEIGARLVSFGQVVTFHIQDVGYYGPDVITFYGTNDKGENLQLIQHTSQLSVLLVAMKKLEEKPKRIGFIWDEEEPDKTGSSGKGLSRR